MAGRRIRRTEEEPGFQLAPMIDMTFLLLIFFMVTTYITDQKVMRNVVVPVAPHATVPRRAEDRVVINIASDGQMFLGDRGVDEKALAEELRRLLRDDPPLQLYVRADREVGAASIRKVVRMAAEAGAIKVILGTTNRK